MDKFDFRMRDLFLKRKKEKPKSIHKKWVSPGAALRALFSDFMIVLQLCVLAGVYAYLAYKFRIFWYVSIALTCLTAVYVAIFERDRQSKVSWILLFIASCGCGYIIYFLASKQICYGYNRRKFARISERAENYTDLFRLENASPEVEKDCNYIYESGGYIPYTGTDLKYYSNARALFDNMAARIEKAEKFIFMEFFIVADSVLLDRLISIFRRKSAEGVEIRLLCDDVGCAGMITTTTMKRLKEAGVKVKIFKKLLTVFSFGLNFRDHRKIVVIDGQTGYVGGINVADSYTNEKRMEGIWKDAGLRLDGAAVDGLTLTFLRQWEFATKEWQNFGVYLNHYERTENTAQVVPYAGGPEIKEALCRGVYHSVISGAKERLYVMTPYFIPDSEMYKQIREKAKAGVDVRLVLPAVPDYPFIYRVTRANAERLIKHGVKVYYARGEFVHSKVMLTENCATVGSINMDMRAFYQEFDNGVYTDDGVTMNEIREDFLRVFAFTNPARRKKWNPFGAIINGVLRIVSPLM